MLCLRVAILLFLSLKMASADREIEQSSSNLGIIGWPVADKPFIDKLRLKQWSERKHGWGNPAGWCHETPFNDIESDFKSLNGDRKRSTFQTATEAPCTCEEAHQPRILGPQYFPGVIPEVYCIPTSCSNSSFTCHTKNYKMKILRRRNIAKRDKIDNILPLSLRQDWFLEDMQVNVSCDLVRK